jgi:hypothetical protein
MKFINFFLFLWVIFALLEPDSDTDPGTPLNPDPDPQHWFKEAKDHRNPELECFGVGDLAKN